MPPGGARRGRVTGNYGPKGIVNGDWQFWHQGHCQSVRHGARRGWATGSLSQRPSRSGSRRRRLPACFSCVLKQMCGRVRAGACGRACVRMRASVGIMAHRVPTQAVTCMPLVKCAHCAPVDLQCPRSSRTRLDAGRRARAALGRAQGGPAGRAQGGPAGLSPAGLPATDRRPAAATIVQRACLQRAATISSPATDRRPAADPGPAPHPRLAAATDPRPPGSEDGPDPSRLASHKLSTLCGSSRGAPRSPSPATDGRPAADPGPAPEVTVTAEQGARALRGPA
jgi:hypothetical protein